MDGVETSALVDSGSQVTLIYKKFFDTLERSLYPLKDLVLWHGGDDLMPYLGWTEINLGFNEKFCGTQKMFRTLALVVPDSRSAVDYQLIVGTNAGVFKDCYSEVQRDSSGVTIDAVCDKIYEDIRCSTKAGPDGLLGYVKLKARGRVEIPAGSTKQVVGVIRNKCGKSVTGLLDSFVPNKLPGGIEVSCSLCTIKRGFSKVKVCLTNQNQNNRPVILSRRCIVAGAYLTSWVSDTSSETSDVPNPSSSGVVQCKVTSSTVKTPNQTSPSPKCSITEEEFRKLPFDWGPIDAKEKERLLKIAFQRAEVFSTHEWDIGVTTEAYHEIRLNNEEPFRERSRRVAPRDLQDLRDHIQSLVDIGVITESRSRYASPIVIVRKKNGQIRLCIDYRTLNARTIPDQYAVPLVHEALDCLHGCNWFSVIDLKSGYYQIPMNPEDKEKTAFVCPVGFYQFERMPQGVKGAPATFQRLMERCMAGLNMSEVLVYMDDIIVFSSTLEQMEERLAKVFDRLAEFGLKVSPNKCQFCCTSVRYLGHIVSGEGVQTDPGKVEALKLGLVQTMSVNCDPF